MTFLDMATRLSVPPNTAIVSERAWDEVKKCATEGSVDVDDLMGSMRIEVVEDALERMILAGALSAETGRPVLYEDEGNEYCVVDMSQADPILSGCVLMIKRLAFPPGA